MSGADAPAGGGVRWDRRGILAAASVLGVLPVLGVLRLFGGPPPPPGRRRAPFLFGAGAGPRVDALRDRLASGLLSLQLAGGGFSPRPEGVDVDPMARAETTAIGAAGLAAAWRLGSKVPGIEDGVARVRAALTQLQTQTGQIGTSRRPSRGLLLSAVSSGVMAYCIADVAEDRPYLEKAAGALVFQASMGTLPGGWVQGVAARALAALREVGLDVLLGGDPVAAFPSKPVELARRVTDSHLSQALVLQLQTEVGAPPVDLPTAVARRVLDEPPAYTGMETDVATWVLEAWLLARVPGGETWFAEVLPELEKAPSEKGVIEGEYYGDPISRTAGALLIAWEGGGRRGLPG